MSLNRCEFIGNLGSDPELRALPNGDAVANFSVAVTERWTNKQTGQKEESTEWVRCVAFRRQAEVCGQYLVKGSKVFVAGKMKTRKWQDQSGETKYSTEIVINEMLMLDTRASQGDQGQARPQPQKQANVAQGAVQESTGVVDDDIPF